MGRDKAKNKWASSTPSSVGGVRGFVKTSGKELANAITSLFPTKSDAYVEMKQKKLKLKKKKVLVDDLAPQNKHCIMTINREEGDERALGLQALIVAGFKNYQLQNQCEEPLILSVKDRVGLIRTMLLEGVCFHYNMWIKGEPLLLETTIGRIVLLLPVVPDRAESELDASVERLFDEGGSGNQTKQGDSTGGGKDADIQPVIEAADTVVEGMAPVQPKCQGKTKSMIVDAGGASHPPKKLREDHGAPSGASPCLLLPFLTTSISFAPERESGDHTDSAVGPNLCAIGAPPRFVISSDSSHHSGTNVAEAEVDSLVRSFVSIMTTVTTITSTVDPASSAKKNLLNPFRFVLTLLRLVELIPPWVSSRILLAVIFFHVCHEMVDEFAYPKFFAYVRGMKHDQLFTKFNVRAARQMSLSAKVRMQLLLREAEATKAIRLPNALDVKVTELEASAVGKERELTDLNALITSVKSQNDILVDRVHEPEISSSKLQEKVIVYKNCMDWLEKFQDDRMKVVNDKFEKLYTDFIDEKFYPHLLTTVFGRMWLLTHGMELAIVKCLNSPEYLFALGAAISKAIKKGMQYGLSTGIVHGRQGRVLTDVAAHNPLAEVDYTYALQQLQNVNFSLLEELKSNKDASVKTVMDILRLEGPLAEKIGLNELQPNVDQLMVPIHRLTRKRAMELAEVKVVDKAILVLAVAGAISEVPSVPVKTAAKKGSAKGTKTSRRADI
nr:transposase (putative), gypsy type [Tanacetum cinerariifolium]